MTEKSDELRLSNPKEENEGDEKGGYLFARERKLSCDDGGGGEALRRQATRRCGAPVAAFVWRTLTA